MAKGLEFRVLAATGVLIPTPLYVDDELLSAIVLGEKAKQWSSIHAMLRREGMPEPRRAMGGLYYLPAQLQFLQRREGVQNPQGGDYADDGPENFGP